MTISSGHGGGFGEWLEVGAEQRCALVRHHPGPVATAYLHRSAAELADVRASWANTTAEHSAALAAHVADAWRTEFLADDGTTTPDAQRTTPRPHLDLIPHDLRGKRDRLVTVIRAADDHLSTGFLATPFLLPILADTDHLDVTYDLLFQDAEPWWPSWSTAGRPLCGRSRRLDADGRPHASLNHYSKGAVISFLHRYVTASTSSSRVPTLPVSPRPGGGITSARARHDSPHGRIEVAWRIVDSSGTLDVTVPDGTSADIALPNGTSSTATGARTDSPGRHRPDQAPDARP